MERIFNSDLFYFIFGLENIQYKAEKLTMKATIFYNKKNC